MNIRRERKDAAESRRLILQTAESLFAEHGVNAVSMHQIAKTCGIGQGTLYRRYAHKGDLCCDLINDYCEQIVQKTKDFLSQPAHEASAQERLATLLNLWIDALEEKADFVLAMEAQHSKQRESSKGAAWFESPMYLFMRKCVAELLKQIVQEEPDRSIDPILTAHALICSMAPIGYFHLKRELGYTTEQMKQGYRAMYRLPAPK